MIEWAFAFQPSPTGTLNLWRTNAFFLDRSKKRVNALFNTAQSAGVDVLYDTEVTDLVLDDGFARAVKATSAASATLCRARRR